LLGQSCVRETAVRRLPIPAPAKRGRPIRRFLPLPRRWSASAQAAVPIRSLLAAMEDLVEEVAVAVEVRPLRALVREEDEASRAREAREARLVRAAGEVQAERGLRSHVEDHEDRVGEVAVAVQVAALARL